jgi:hypothetical protein
MKANEIKEKEKTIDFYTIILIYTFVLLLAGIVTLFFQKQNIDENLQLLKIKNIVLEQKHKSIDKSEYKEALLEEKINELMGYNAFISRLENKWSYQILINREVQRQNKIYVKEGDILVEVCEELLDDGAIAREILNRGSITGGKSKVKLEDCMTFSGNYNINIEGDEAEKTKKVSFYIKTVKKGEEITVNLNQVLARRLNMREPKLTIHVE